MKRSVAILGPTPQFVRWAILYECPLRQIEIENLPDATFRQLRGLRELSVGLVEGRVFDGICVHPDASSAEPNRALGFPVNEVLDAHGDESFVASNCGCCPANAIARQRPGVWAGCYGWLSASADFRFEITSENSLLPHSETTLDQNPASTGNAGDQLVELLEDAIKGNSWTQQAKALFPETSPHWYGIWQNSRLNSEQANFLVSVFDALVTQVSSMPSESFGFISDLRRFLNALRCCVENSLELHVELIPPGDSDGTTWTQFAHCPTCKCVMNNARQPSQSCPACGRKGNLHGARKGKVLGLRPYVNLCGVIGETGTRDFLERYESQGKEER